MTPMLAAAAAAAVPRAEFGEGKGDVPAMEARQLLARRHRSIVTPTAPLPFAPAMAVELLGLPMLTLPALLLPAASLADAPFDQCHCRLTICGAAASLSSTEARWRLEVMRRVPGTAWPK